MKAFAVILLAMVAGAMASHINLSKRHQELDLVTRTQLREQRLRRWCTQCKIDYQMVMEITGMRTTGEVYRDENNDPLPDTGVIIGTEIDLGYITEDFLRDDLHESEDIIEKLKPYLGLKGTDAADKLASVPLILTEGEATRLSNLFLDELIELIEKLYDITVESIEELLDIFSELPCEVKTAIVTLYNRYKNRVVSWWEGLWDKLTRQLWESAKDILKEIKDLFSYQRSMEIELLSKTEKKPCNCTGWAYICHDPHIATFDGRHFSSQGVCTYILFTDGCGKTRGSFRVESTTEAAIVNGKDVSKVSALAVEIMDQSYPTTINLNRNDVTLINGKPLTTLPYYVNADTVMEKTVFNEIRVRMFGKFAVTWDGDSRIQTSVDNELFGSVCGLLGDADGDKTNDLRMPNGTLTKSIDEFGKSWEVPGSNC